MFRKVLVANRGEIAVRVMRACQELDIATVAIYSEADKHAGHVRYADEAYKVGPTSPAESYLDGETIVEIAERANADAIHPGYGFLAENADFAERVEESGAVWIGPPSDVMRELGTKTGGRRTMAAADVPVVPGTTDPVSSVEEIERFGDKHGYPVAIKADTGGGGRGMKIVEHPDEIEEKLESAQREGDAYFDDETVYLEKFLPSPKHIEVQVLADQHGTARHLGERDCSLQRRQQKLVEEAPAPTLDPALRERIGEAARRGIEAAGYTNAGTVEFLVADDAFYFMEVNTRIQVEHCVTEAITGIDIVKWQLRVAAGEPLAFEQSDVTERGHAIEYRINAENPADDFAPTPGTLSTYDPPGGIGVRLDDAVRQGDEVSGEYDPLVAKLIVHASDREECLDRSERALREFEIDGVHTTIPFHRLMVTDQIFIEGSHTTRYLDDELDADRLAAAVDRWGPDDHGDEAAAPAPNVRQFTVEVNGKRFDVTLEDEESEAPPADESADAHEPTDRETVSVPVGDDGEEVTAEMEGTILSVDVAEGEDVAAGDVLCVLEAMKMENDIVAGVAGTVSTVAISAGDRVELGQTLIVIE